MNKTTAWIVIITMLSCAIKTETHAQSFQTHVPVYGIKIIIEQDNPAANYKVNSGIAVNKQAAITEKQLKTEVQKEVQTDLQKKVAQSGVYVSQSSPAKQSSQSNSPKTVFNAPGLFTKSFIAPFFTTEVRKEIEEGLKGLILQEIKKKLPSGFGIHSQSNLQLGSALETETGYFAHSLNPSATVKIKFPQNRLFVRVTTPDGVPGGLDPNAVLFFDLTVTCPIYFPTHSSQISSLPKLGDVTIAATNISEPTSRNIISKILIDMIPVIKGPGFFNQLRQNRYYVFPADRLNNELSGIKKSLAGLPAMRIENYSEGSMLVLKATNKKEEYPVVK